MMGTIPDTLSISEYKKGLRSTGIFDPFTDSRMRETPDGRERKWLVEIHSALHARPAAPPPSTRRQKRVEKRDCVVAERRGAGGGRGKRKNAERESRNLNL